MAENKVNLGVGPYFEASFDLPYCLYVKDGTYPVRVGDLTASIELTRIKQPVIDPRLGIAKAEGMQLMHDRRGFIHYSHAKVTFPARVVFEAEVGKPFDNVEAYLYALANPCSQHVDPALETAISAVNRFVAVYRYVSDDFHIRPIVHEEIHRADVKLFRPSGGFLRGAAQSQVPFSSERIGFDPVTMERLRYFLVSDEQIPTTFTLFSDARDHLEVGDYRLAVIDARTALEVLVDEELLRFFGTRSDPVGHAYTILSPRMGKKKLPTVEDVLLFSSINSKLENGLLESLGLDLKARGQLWTNWEEAKTLREGAAHRGQIIERDEATKAVETMGQIIDEIYQAGEKN